ncbi:hypothetical protein IP84_06540 [beta proteobacterium AAP99]|nr:hypothetical protein IP84_06540 [beta proteobacterium AAP99]
MNEVILDRLPVLMSNSEYARWRVFRAIWEHGGGTNTTINFGPLWGKLRSGNGAEDSLAAAPIWQAFDLTVTKMPDPGPQRALSAAQMLRRQTRALSCPRIRALAEIPYLSIALRELEVARSFRLIRRRAAALRIAGAHDLEALWLAMAAQAVALLGATDDAARWVRQALKALMAAKSTHASQPVRTATLLSLVQYLGSAWLRQDGFDLLSFGALSPARRVSAAASVPPVDAELIHLVAAALQTEGDCIPSVDIAAGRFFLRALDPTAPRTESWPGIEAFEHLLATDTLTSASRDLAILVAIGLALSKRPSEGAEAMSRLVERLIKEQLSAPDELLLGAAICGLRARDVLQPWRYLRASMVLSKEREAIAKSHSFLAYVCSSGITNDALESVGPSTITAEAIEFLAQNARVQVSVPDLANYFGVSTRYIFKYFRAEFDSSPKKWLREIRLA